MRFPTSEKNVALNEFLLATIRTADRNYLESAILPRFHFESSVKNRHSGEGH